MLHRSRLVATGLFGLYSMAGLSIPAGIAHAAPVIVNLNADFSTSAKSFSFDDSTFTFSPTGDIFNPAAIQTSGGGAVRSFGGFFIFPLTPSTDFPDRGSGILSYGPGTQFSAFTDRTTIPFSNGDNYLGLRATLNGADYYGYAFTTNTTLNSFGFETVANTPFVINTSTTAVPEVASWAMFIGGFGAIGGAMRRRRTIQAHPA